MVCSEKATNVRLTYQDSGERGLPESLYRSVAHRIPGNRSQITAKYEKEYMKVTTEAICRTRAALSNANTVVGERRHALWVVPASFCAARYLSDPRCLPLCEKKRRLGGPGQKRRQRSSKLEPRSLGLNRETRRHGRWSLS